MSKKRVKTDTALRQTPPKKASSAFERLQVFAGIVDSGGLQLSTEAGKRFREILRRKSAEESKRV